MQCDRNDLIDTLFADADSLSCGIITTRINSAKQSCQQFVSSLPLSAFSIMMSA